MSAALDRGRQARELFRAARSGVLSSHSSKFPGFPYGSALPFITDHDGGPIVLISHLAEHTRNIEADSRVSFLVSDPGPDVQSTARATLLGHARRLDEAASQGGRYLRLFPDHARYLDIGGFAFWKIDVVQVRLIEGFARLHWIEAAAYRADAGDLPELEISILEHMNQDHQDAISAYCRYSYGIDPERPQMIGFDCDGFDVRADGRLLRFKLPQPVRTAQQARAALAQLARESRV